MYLALDFTACRVARIAQSVEHQTFNLRVQGSSPCSGGSSSFELLGKKLTKREGGIYGLAEKLMQVRSCSLSPLKDHSHWVHCYAMHIV